MGDTDGKNPVKHLGWWQNPANDTQEPSEFWQCPYGQIESVAQWECRYWACIKSGYSTKINLSTTGWCSTPPCCSFARHFTREMVHAIAHDCSSLTQLSPDSQTHRINVWYIYTGHIYYKSKQKCREIFQSDGASGKLSAANLLIAIASVCWCSVTWRWRDSCGCEKSTQVPAFGPCRVLYTHYRDSLLKVGWPSPIYPNIRSWSTLAHVRFSMKSWLVNWASLEWLIIVPIYLGVSSTT